SPRLGRDRGGEACQEAEEGKLTILQALGLGRLASCPDRTATTRKPPLGARPPGSGFLTLSALSYVPWEAKIVRREDDRLISDVRELLGPVDHDGGGRRELAGDRDPIPQSAPPH